MDNVEAKVLRHVKNAVLEKRWKQLWEEIGQRISTMPLWMQNIVLEDINTAVQNRLAVMEMIQKTRGGRRQTP